MDGAIAMDRLRDHYKHCIRLSASNKINPKNAFDLQLIDYMQDLVSSTVDGQMNFKIASSALDVGAKIYSNRVDCIQSEAQKVASSILMALDGQQSKTHDNPDDSQLDGNTSANSDRLDDSRDGDEAQAKAKKKRPTRNRNVKTIVEDDHLLDSNFEKMVLGDAYLDGLSQDFDMSCPAALISYNPLIRTEPRTCLLTIESSHSRTDYRELSDPLSTSSKPEILSRIDEEPENDIDDQISSDEQENSDKQQQDQTSIQQNDNEREATSKEDSHQTGDNTNTSLCNFVTLITKNVNCAQIIRNNHNNHICPRLENFLFNDRTTTISGMNTDLDSSIHIKDDGEKLNLSSNKPSEFNPELYGNNDDYGDDHFGDADSVAGDVENRPGNENDIIPNLDKIAASKPTDYGYTNEHHRLLNTWAGPHAWKVIKVPQSTKKDALLKSTRKRIKLEQKPIDFSEPFSPGLEKLTDKEIRHSADVIKRWKKPLRPQDHNLTEESVRKIFLESLIRPEDTYHCMKTPAEASKLVDIDHDYSRTDNDGGEDDAPASPGLAGFDDVHDDSEDEFRADPVIDGNEAGMYGALINNTLTHQSDLEFAGEHLIEQPYTVAQVNIPFAKIAKKMDVRKLKRVMWDLLLPEEKRLDITTPANVTVVENILEDMDKSKETDCTVLTNGHPTVLSGDEPNDTVIENGDPTKKGDPSPAPSESAVHLEFSNLYGELPVRVSTKMASDLSQPIAFVTLLHLANEKVSCLIYITSIFLTLRDSC